MPNSHGNVYKIAILGDEGSGKTALLVRFLTGRYIVEYDPTIEDTYRKIFLVNDEPESVDILDTTQKGTSVLRKQFLAHGDAFVLVYSITDRHSFEMMESYDNEIRKNRGHLQPYKISLVGNKNDLENWRQVTKEEGEKLASKNGWLFCEASAAENTAIPEVFFGLSGTHNGNPSEILGSSNSDSEGACSSSEKSPQKKILRKKNSLRRATKFNIFKWHSQYK